MSYHPAMSLQRQPVLGKEGLIDGERRVRADRRAADPIAEDDLWIQQTLSGDQGAFAQLIRKYQQRLFDLAMRILNNAEEAEDAVQDAFIEAYRHLSDFSHKSKFSTWVYAIVLNRVRNRLRRNRVLRWFSLDFIQGGDPENPTPRQLSDTQPALELQIDKKLQLESVEKVIRTFALHYQTIFIMYYFQNLSLEEIAVHLERPMATVKVYLHRARQMLYKKLAENRAVTFEKA